MLLRSQAAIILDGQTIESDDPRDHLHQAAAQQGLIKFDPAVVSGWKYMIQGCGNWLLARLLCGELVSCFLIGMLGAILQWSALQIGAVTGGVVLLAIIEVFLLATTWETVEFDPATTERDTAAWPPLPPHMQHIAQVMSSEWRAGDRAWPLHFSLERLHNPIWRPHGACILRICSIYEGDVVALHPGDR